MDAKDRLEQRWERRRRTAKRSKALTIAAVSISLAAGFAIGAITVSAPTVATPVETIPPAMTAPAVTRHQAHTVEWMVKNSAAVSDDQEDPEDPEIKEAQTEQTAALLRSVPFDGNTQNAIYELCGKDDDLFCSVMAIGENESRFTATAVGDGGRCVGWMQINYAYHTERMERLGVTDLTDPVQCAAVAIDYLKELSASFGDTDTHALYMAYNRGPTGARAAMNAGVFSDTYSWNVMASRDSFKTELASNTQ